MTEQQVQGSEFSLRYPLVFEGKQVASLHLNFAGLSADDIIAAERQFVAETGENPFVKETSKLFQAYIAARAADVPIELVKKINASDFSRLTLRVQNFLLGVD